MPPTKPTEKPSERFKSAVQQILSVPKAEIVKREGEYKAARQAKNKHRRRHR